MSAPLFTPGPWKTGDCDGFIVWAGGYRSVDWIECDPGPEAVHIGDAACPAWAMRPEIEAELSLDDLTSREVWIDECKANARLMAAAPELYEALAAMVEWNIKRGPFDEPLGESEQEDEINAAVAVLRKARGESA